MKRIVVGLLSLAVFGVLAYYSGFLYTNQQYQEIGPEEKNPVPIDTTEGSETEESSAKQPPSKPEENLAETSIQAGAVEASFTEGEMEFSYYLVEEFGYINIYLKDKETIYEFTDIRIEDLPQDLQDEICTGKGVTTEQELYDFLENYSS